LRKGPKSNSHAVKGGIAAVAAADPVVAEVPAIVRVCAGRIGRGQNDLVAGNVAFFEKDVDFARNKPMRELLPV
jgi:hypothetical protein